MVVLLLYKYQLSLYYIFAHECRQDVTPQRSSRYLPMHTSMKNCLSAGQLTFAFCNWGCILVMIVCIFIIYYCIVLLC